jgi:hypothetical protein
VSLKNTIFYVPSNKISGTRLFLFENQGVSQLADKFFQNEHNAVIGVFLRAPNV